MESNLVDLDRLKREVVDFDASAMSIPEVKQEKKPAKRGRKPQLVAYGKSGEKLEKRREQNRRAAAVYRHKQKDKKLTIEQQHEILAQDNERLQQENGELRKQKEQLQRIVQNHVCLVEQNNNLPTGNMTGNMTGSAVMTGSVHTGNLQSRSCPSLTGRLRNSAQIGCSSFNQTSGGQTSSYHASTHFDAHCTSSGPQYGAVSLPSTLSEPCLTVPHVSPASLPLALNFDTAEFNWSNYEGTAMPVLAQTQSLVSCNDQSLIDSPYTPKTGNYIFTFDNPAPGKKEQCFPLSGGVERALSPAYSSASASPDPLVQAQATPSPSLGMQVSMQVSMPNTELNTGDFNSIFSLAAFNTNFDTDLDTVSELVQAAMEFGGSQ